MLATQKIKPSQRCRNVEKLVINGLKYPTDMMLVVIVNLKYQVIKALL